MCVYMYIYICIYTHAYIHAYVSHCNAKSTRAYTSALYVNMNMKARGARHRSFSTCKQQVVATARRLKRKVGVSGVRNISRVCFGRCCSNKKTPPYHSNLSFVRLQNRRPTLLRAPAYRSPCEASPRRRCGDASRFLSFKATVTRASRFVRRPAMK